MKIDVLFFFRNKQYRDNFIIVLLSAIFAPSCADLDRPNDSSLEKVALTETPLDPTKKDKKSLTHKTKCDGAEVTTVWQEQSPAQLWSVSYGGRHRGPSRDPGRSSALSFTVNSKAHHAKIEAILIPKSNFLFCTPFAEYAENVLSLKSFGWAVIIKSCFITCRSFAQP